MHNFSGKLLEKQLLGKPRRWKYNSKLYPTEVDLDDGKWMELVKDRVQ